MGVCTSASLLPVLVSGVLLVMATLLVIILPLAPGSTVTVKTMVPDAPVSSVGVYQVSSWPSVVKLGSCGSSFTTPPKVTLIGSVSVM